VYGTDRKKVQELAASERGLGEPLHGRLPYLQAEVLWATRQEMARTVEDVLARRTRALLLDSAAAADAAPRVAEILAKELHRDTAWQEKQIEEFRSLAKVYQLR
jgi:glycerol-3-phosphate dehydrogenase